MPILNYCQIIYNTYYDVWLKIIIIEVMFLMSLYNKIVNFFNAIYYPILHKVIKLTNVIICIL